MMTVLQSSVRQPCRTWLGIAGLPLCAALAASAPKNIASVLARSERGHP